MGPLPHNIFYKLSHCFAMAQLPPPCYLQMAALLRSQPDLLCSSPASLARKLSNLAADLGLPLKKVRGLDLPGNYKMQFLCSFQGGRETPVFLEVLA